jgi:D-alanyl-D-alanine carboxypeptidase
MMLLCLIIAVRASCPVASPCNFVPNLRHLLQVVKRQLGLVIGIRQFAGQFGAANYMKQFMSLFVALMILSACQTSDVMDASRPTVPQMPDKFAAIVIDGGTGKSLYALAASDTRYPASLTKMMTLYLLFEAMASGQVTKDSLITISANAASQRPSKIGLKEGSTIDVDSAIRAITVKSANDIAVAIAEYLAGSEDQFAARMTNKARELGMTRTTFRNASGLHDPLQVTTATDMARLGLSLRQKFPQYFSYFSLRECIINGKSIKGHDRVLDMVEGADGIKTGYTKDSGFNLVTSVWRNGKLMVAVVMGEDTAKIRDARMAGLIKATFDRVQ